MSSAALLIVIAAAAFVLPLIAGALNVPAVVLEILFGILIGPSVLDVVDGADLLQTLARLGFFLLMFLSGLEIDFERIRQQGPRRMGTSLLLFATTMALAYVSAGMLGFGVFMMFVLATTSVGIVVPTLRSARLEGSHFGQTTLVSAVMADFLTLLAVTVFAVVYTQGVGLELINVPAFFLLVWMMLVALRRLAWWFPERMERLFSSTDPEELGIRASLALMLVFVGLSRLMSIEPILGAFMAGAVFALVFPRRGQLEQKLSGFGYGFLIPIFFINVGVRFDLRALFEVEVLLVALALMAAAIVVKLVPSLLLVFSGFSLRQSLAAGTLLSARLSLIIAVAELGRALELIDHSTESSIILLALVTTSLAPIVFRRLVPDAAPAASMAAARA